MKSFSIIGLFLILFSCQDKKASFSSSDTKIFANYYVRYLESETFIKAEAWFLEGDSLASAQPKNWEKSIHFMDFEMGQKPLKDGQIKYNYENIGAYPKAFKFTDLKNGSPKEVNIEVLPIKDFTVQNCSLEKGLTIDFSEIPLIENQTLIIFVKDEHEQTNSFEISGPSSIKNINITFDERSKKLNPGNGQLLIIKKEEKTLLQENFVIQTTLEYYAAGREILITE